MNALAKSLHEKAFAVSHDLRRVEARLLDVLQQIDRYCVYLDLGFSSLFQYVTQALGLSEATAYNFITVSRKAREVPQIQKEIEEGKLTVCKAKVIAPVVKQENALEWIEKAKSLPKAKLEKEVVRQCPEKKVAERASYVGEERLKLQLGISEELMEKLRRVKDVLSQKKRRAVSMEEALEAMAGDFLERHDPIVKAKRVLEKKSPHPQLFPGRVVSEKADSGVGIPLIAVPKATSSRVSLPAVTRHHVFLRDGGQCTFIDHEGRRCEQRRWLEIDHKVPVALGGNNEPANLRTLCSAHHRWRHRRA